MLGIFPKYRKTVNKIAERLVHLHRQILYTFQECVFAQTPRVLAVVFTKAAVVSLTFIVLRDL